MRLLVQLNPVLLSVLANQLFLCHPAHLWALVFLARLWNLALHQNLVRLLIQLNPVLQMGQYHLALQLSLELLLHL